MSRPSKTIEPAVGSISLMIVRPSVVLPQPDSPTTPSVSPFLTVRSTPSTARTAPTVCLKTPALIGKCLTRPSTRSKASSSRRHVGRGALEPLAGSLRHRSVAPPPAAAPATTCASASSSAKWHAEWWSAPSPIWRSVRNVRAADEPALRERAARMERAAGRRRDHARRLARDRLEPLLVARRAGRGCSSARPCTGGAAR